MSNVVVYSFKNSFLGKVVKLLKKGTTWFNKKDDDVEDVIRMKGVNETNSVIDSDISKGQSFLCAPQQMDIYASNYRYKDNAQWSKDCE
ncbi:MAG: hypothetical protein EZS28_052287 [Streblomastix strix]|uniref:Uncharacterized protein n=1 Tax=Streblomastix strix TaxID=222440 RepID=A0A5J4SCL1_9EUKA|nr:MAG: hypothetical protein EZS28_052287 [Streblomastix strix]